MKTEDGANKTIYISEPLTGRPDLEDIKTFCRRVGGICTDLGLNPYLPFDATDPVANPNVSPLAVYEKDKRETQSARGIIFVIPKGEPQSLGVGMEMAYATMAEVPGVVVVDRGVVLEENVDGMVASNEALGLWVRVLMNGLNDEDVFPMIKQSLNEKVVDRVRPGLN